MSGYQTFSAVVRSAPVSAAASLFACLVNLAGRTISKRREETSFLVDLKPRHENTSLLYHALRLSVQQGDCVDRLYIRHKRSYLELSVSSAGVVLTWRAKR